MKTSSYNLIDRTFIRVVTKDGPAIVTLRDALAQADSIIGVDSSSPLETVALYRFLLAVILDIAGLPPTIDEWRARFETGHFDHDRIDSYFDRYHDRFDLFGEHPFYQVAGLEPSSGIWKSVALLRPEVASGNNVPLFSSETDATLPPFTFAEAAVHLLSCMCWDPAAIKTGAVGDPAAKAGKTTGNPTGPLGQLGVTLPMGRSLFETLMLSVPIGPSSDEDIPAWRRDWGPQWSQHQPKGIKELLTWQSRRIRLQSDGNTIVAVTVSAGDRLEFTPPDLEPHCIWRQVKPGPKTTVSVSQRPVRHQPGRSAWRGMNALLSMEEHDGNSDEFSTSLALRQIGWVHGLLGDTYPLDVLCVGVLYGNQSAVVEDVIADSIPVPVRALSDADGTPLRRDLVELAERAEAVRKALNDLDANIRRAEGGDAVPWGAGNHPGDNYMSQLDTPTLRVLHVLQKEPDLYEEGMAAWQRVVWDSAGQLAEQLLDSAAPSAVAGRQVKGRNQPLRLSDAQAIFWGALNKALPDRTNRPKEEQ